MVQLLETIGGNPVLLIFGVGGVIAVVGIACGSFISIIRIRSLERTRREIAAYIAEGSMSAEQGERLMKAGRDDLEDA
ncbi:MAG: hypothetical protein KAS72_15475 [Phycisphaerales bacterium]|nr:hypothetical protein [Phycisphaerales bacterium]